VKDTVFSQVCDTCSLTDLQTFGEKYFLHLRLQMEATSNVDIQGDSGLIIIIWEAIIPIIVGKKVHMNTCLILNGYRGGAYVFLTVHHELTIY
jgi:hypothetical protein